MDAQARIAQLEAEIASRDARIGELEQRVAKLTALVAELTESHNRNSRNSHLPPSSDGPGARGGGQGPKKKSGRRRGGQPGRKGSRRELLPPEEVDDFVDHFPANCENCQSRLPRIADDAPVRHQTTELPPIKPYTTEHRRHAVSCPECAHRTRAAFDDELIPTSPFGPRLMSVIALLTGVYHLSRRKTVDLLSDVVGVEISLGAVSAVEARVSAAVEPAVEEAWRHVARARVKHTDGTSWLRSGAMRALWTIATAMATVFKILPDSRKETLAALFGTKAGILVSDRAKALNFWAMERRQVCWAHYADFRIMPTWVRRPASQAVGTAMRSA